MVYDCGRQKEIEKYVTQFRYENIIRCFIHADVKETHFRSDTKSRVWSIVFLVSKFKFGVYLILEYVSFLTEAVTFLSIK